MFLARFIAFVAFVSVVAAQYPEDCTFDVGGCSFDLSALEDPNGDYRASGAVANGSVFYVNVCRPVVTTACGSDVAACYVWESGRASLGNVGRIGAPRPLPGGGLRLWFDGGLRGRSMNVDFWCSSSNETGGPRWVPNPGSEHFIFEWKTKHACGRCAKYIA